MTRAFLSRKALRRLLILFLLLMLTAAAGWLVMIHMPGRSFHGPLPPLTPEQTALRDELRADVEKLATGIGERNTGHYDKLTQAADFIEKSFTQAGCTTRRQGYTVEGKNCDNLVAEIPGTSGGIVVVGGHYDSIAGSPGANDNGTGVAGTLALARRFAKTRPRRTLRFVAFVNEEPPHFQTEKMGSFVYAKACRERGDKIVAMVSIETIGCYLQDEGSQEYPLPILKKIYPARGNFIGFIGNTGSASLVKKSIGSFRRHAQFPSEGAAMFEWIPGVGWSDQWSFWRHGYCGIMVTDTAPFRYAHYHTGSDSAAQIDFDSMARVVDGLEKVVAELAR